MQQRVLSTIHAELDAFLAAHLGVIHVGDVGPWLGQAAAIYERRAVDVRVPSGWQEAVNTALSAEAAASGVRHASSPAWRTKSSGVEARPR